VRDYWGLPSLVLDGFVLRHPSDGPFHDIAPREAAVVPSTIFPLDLMTAGQRSKTHLACGWYQEHVVVSSPPLLVSPRKRTVQKKPSRRRGVIMVVVARAVSERRARPARPFAVAGPPSRPCPFKAASRANARPPPGWRLRRALPDRGRFQMLANIGAPRGRIGAKEMRSTADGCCRARPERAPTVRAWDAAGSTSWACPQVCPRR